MKTDEELIQSYLDGNELAFKELFDRYAKTLYMFVFRICGKEEIIEDVLQETFIKIWKKIKYYTFGENTFKSWIFTIARNTTIDHLRKKKIAVLSDFDTDDGYNYVTETAIDQETIPENLIEKAENQKLVKKVLDSLPEIDREILILHYQEDMTFENIGKILNKPLNTVKSRHRRAVLKLRDFLVDSP